MRSGILAAALIGSQAFFMDAHRIADLATVLGTVWIAGRLIGTPIWRLVEGAFRIAEEFKAMRVEIKNLSVRVSALEDAGEETV